MGSLAEFQLNRSTNQQHHADAKRAGGVAPRSHVGDKLGDMLGLARLESRGRFRPLQASGPMAASEHLYAESTVDVSDLEQPEFWTLGGKATTTAGLQAYSPFKVDLGGQFMRLFVHAAKKGQLFHVQTPPRSLMRFQYIRLLLLGNSVAMDASPSLSQLLRARTPRHMAGPESLEEAVAAAFAGIGDVDTGQLLDLVERQLMLEDDTADSLSSRDKLIRDIVGSTFNLFFNWIAFLIAGRFWLQVQNIVRAVQMNSQLSVPEGFPS